MTLRIEVVTAVEQFATIQAAWQELWERSGSFIFQSHSWITGWLNGVHNRKEIRLQVALAWDGDRLCGALPCAVHRRSGLRVLSWAAQLFSDYCDCLLDPAYEMANPLQALWRGLEDFGGFDLISLQQVRPDAKCRQFLDQLVRDGGRMELAEREERCMRIENHWADGEGFFRSLNKKGRNNHTRGKRILAELGGDVRFRVLKPGDDASALIDEIMGLKHTWLVANDPQSALLGNDRAILRAVLDKAWEGGLARIFVLECGERVAAASFNFVYAGRMEAYFTAYDLAFDRASPGTILIVDYGKWAFDQGLGYVDFLRGEEAFKFRMANAETLLSSFAGYRTLMGQMAMFGHKWLSRRRHRPDVVISSPATEVEAAT